LFEERFQDKFEQLKAESVTKLIEDGQDQLAERLNKFTFNVGRNLGDKMIPIVDVKRLSFDGDGRPKEEPSEYRYEEGVVNILLFWVIYPLYFSNQVASPRGTTSMHMSPFGSEIGSNGKTRLE
jgi:hypothetical protein